MLLNEHQCGCNMTDAILTELEVIETWVSALPDNSTTVPHLIFEDLIELIRFHFGVITERTVTTPIPADPRRAVCVLWPRLCTLVNEASNEAGIPAPWW